MQISLAIIEKYYLTNLHDNYTIVYMLVSVATRAFSALMSSISSLT